jgi:hypothetical protein
MAKLVLISILFATVVVPMRAARDESPSRGLRRAVLLLAAFDLFYALAVVYVYPRLL